MAKRVLIVGAGPGGLTAAMLLAQAGLQVKVIERLPRLGGHTSTLEAQGFRFDPGPTFFLYSRILAESFAATGHDLHREVELVRLDPQYRLVFGTEGEIDATPEVARMEQEIARLAPQDAGPLQRLLADNRTKLERFRPCLESSFLGWRDIFQPHLLRLLPWLRPWRSLDRELQTFFSDPRVRLAAFLDASGADLVSGLPRQETRTFLERLIIPLIHFLLLSFLPFQRMRASRHPAYGSRCGQLFMARREAYEQIGRHAAIRTSLHDGLTLPRAFRTAGLMTDLCDATEVATCRMYRSAREFWHGLAKNATEGLAAPAMIVPASGLLIGGKVVPLVLLGLGIMGRLSPMAFLLASVGVAASYYPRLRAVRRFGQPMLEALLHPLGIIVLLAIQWYACGRALLGRPATWKGRACNASEIGMSAG